MRKTFLVVVLPVLLALAASAANSYRLEGVVQDATGAAVRDAVVTVRSGSSVLELHSAADGRFLADALPAPAATLTVRAPGFAELERSWTAQAAAPLVLVLNPAAIAETLTVTATRAELPLDATAASVVVLAEESVRSTAALTLDDVLRQLPGFSLFRRTSSRVANPTAQGVSLRGVGPSGASRALVLRDGVPLNDPFGGWIYWDRVPRESVGEIEVVRGGASSLYGSDALGGVLQIVSRPAAQPTASISVDYGAKKTPNASLFAGGTLRGWTLGLGGEAFRSDGYKLVDPAERGSVDIAANSSHRVGELTVERRLGSDARIFARGSVFQERRNNGTPLQVNSTGVRQFALGGEFDLHRWGSFAARAFGGDQMFDQSFTAVASDRASERITRLQRVPAQPLGASVQWSRGAGKRHLLLAGVETRDVRGHSDERIFSAVSGLATSRVDAGGRQRTTGFFFEDIVHVTPRLVLNLAARGDRWRNFDAVSRTTPLVGPGATTLTPFAERSETAFSPRLGARFRMTDHVSLVGSVYRAFRAPTLNELYRAFRVGDVLTLANPELRAERLTGGEGGLAVSLPRGATAHATFFWSELSRPIANLTLIVTPALTTRMRQNLGETRSRGLDLNFDAPITRNWHIAGGYEFVNAAVTSFPADRTLEGLLIPQVPRHQVTGQLRYAAAGWTFATQGRWIGAQFEDDRNRLPLGSFGTADVFLSRRVHTNADLFAAVENVFDERYTVGRTPVRTLGAPILARGGVRLHFGAR